jgi:hypothetical protein
MKASARISKTSASEFRRFRNRDRRLRPGQRTETAENDGFSVSPSHCDDGATPRATTCASREQPRSMCLPSGLPKARPSRRSAPDQRSSAIGLAKEHRSESAALLGPPALLVGARIAFSEWPGSYLLIRSDASLTC